MMFNKTNNDASLSEVHESVDTTVKKKRVEKNIFLFRAGIPC